MVIKWYFRVTVTLFTCRCLAFLCFSAVLASKSWLLAQPIMSSFHLFFYRNDEGRGKPILMLSGGLTGSEVSSSEMVLKLARYLLSHWNFDSEISHLLNTYSIYLLPQLDANRYAHSKFPVRCDAAFSCF